MKARAIWRDREVHVTILESTIGFELARLGHGIDPQRSMEEQALSLESQQEFLSRLACRAAGAYGFVPPLDHPVTLQVELVEDPGAVPCMGQFVLTRYGSLQHGVIRLCTVRFDDDMIVTCPLCELVFMVLYHVGHFLDGMGLLSIEALPGYRSGAIWKMLGMQGNTYLSASEVRAHVVALVGCAELGESMTSSACVQSCWERYADHMQAFRLRVIEFANHHQVRLPWH